MGKGLTGNDPPRILVRYFPKPDLTNHNRSSERRWIESVGYTLPACSLFAGLAAALALATGAALCALSGAIATSIPSGLRGPVFVPCAALTAVLLSFACAVLSDVLSLAIEGSMRVVSIPSFDTVLRAIGQWLASLAAGPAILLAAAAVYWLRCGDIDLADGLILAELVVFAGGGFLVNMLLTSPGGDPGKFGLVTATQTAGLLGWRAVTGSIAAAAALFAFAWLGSFVLEKLHVAGVEGFLWLGMWWFCALVLAAFSFRRWGLWYHGATALRQEAASNSPAKKQRGSRIALAQASN
jgi:hypothetical protein